MVDNRKVPADHSQQTRDEPKPPDTFLSTAEAARAADAAGAEVSRGTDTVLIGCKLPLGFTMEIVQPGTAVNADGKPVQMLHPAKRGERVFIKGANSMRVNPRAHQGVHPFAITRVDRSLWEAWIARNADFDFVKRGLVFEAKNERDAQAMAKERLPERTGLEGLNPRVEKDPRMPKASNENAVVETDPASLKNAARVADAA
jgi:hypothetical protein